MKAKFLLAGRIFRAQQAQDPSTYFLAMKRIAQVEEGDENGLLAEIFRKMKKDPNSPLWYKNAKKQKKNEFKNKVKKFLKTQCENKFSLFLNESQQSRSVRNYKKLFQKTNKAAYLEWPLSERSKITQVKLSITNANSDKDQIEKNCRLCQHQKSETSFHLIAECSALETQRTLAFGDTEYMQWKNNKKWKKFFNLKVIKHK